MCLCECCCGRNCCGIIFSITTICLLVATLATPWYFDSFKNDNSGCTETFLWGWMELYCQNTGSCSSLIDSVLKCPFSQTNWRNKCSNNNNNDCDDFETMNTVCAVLSGAAIFFLFFSVAGFILRRNGSERAGWHISTSALSLACMTAAIIYYAVYSTDAWSQFIKSGVPNSYVSCSSNQGPCNSFTGSTTGSFLGLVSITYRWGPAGWGVILASWICGAIVSALSLTNASHGWI